MPMRLTGSGTRASVVETQAVVFVQTTPPDGEVGNVQRTILMDKIPANDQQMMVDHIEFVQQAHVFGTGIGDEQGRIVRQERIARAAIGAMEAPSLRGCRVNGTGSERRPRKSRKTDGREGACPNFFTASPRLVAQMLDNADQETIPVRNWNEVAIGRSAPSRSATRLVSTTRCQSVPSRSSFPRAFAVSARGLFRKSGHHSLVPSRNADFRDAARMLHCAV
jgi:hypothetical protein